MSDSDAETVDSETPIGMCTINQIIDHLVKRESIQFSLVMLYRTDKGELDYCFASRYTLDDEWMVVKGFKELVEERNGPNHEKR